MEVSFKSKYNFVDIHEFRKVTRRCFNYVPFGNQEPYFIKGPQIFTEEVRTCSGGLITNLVETLGYHALDSLIMEELLPEIMQKMLGAINLENARGMIVGSKDLRSRPYSKSNFSCIREYLEKNIKNLTVFREHTHEIGETNFHYDVKTDICTICSRYKLGPHMAFYKDVDTPAELKEAYKEIKIADGDELYIRGKKVDTKLFQP